jgi:tetratricopeptide (TPR) repeat protein
VHPDYPALARQIDECIAQNRIEDAEAALRRMVGINPREHYAWSLLGEISLRRGDAEIALGYLERATELARKDAHYLNLLGVAQAELGRFDAALATLRKATKAKPGYVEPHYNLGKLHEKRGDLAAACDAYRRAMALDPRNPDPVHQLGRAFFLLGDYDAAVKTLEDAVSRHPHDEACAMTLGSALGAACGPEAAIAWYREAVRRIPESGALGRSFAHTLLRAGFNREGWREYLRRPISGSAPRENLPEPLPQDLGGRALTLRAEQGLGDILFFLRFAPALVARGARLVAVMPARLRSILARTGLFAEVRDEATVGQGDPAQIFVGDLPFLVGEEGAPPALALSALPERIEAWRARLAAFGPGPYTGITWRAGTDFRRQSEFGAQLRALHKEAPFDRLAKLAKRLPGTIVSLQRLPDAGEVDSFAGIVGRKVFDAATANDDLDDALALLALLDDYVCVSNTNVHLRAGLGRGGRVLVPYPPEWRWIAEGDVSPWFPDFVAYRQPTDLNWDRPFERLTADLETLR